MQEATKDRQISSPNGKVLLCEQCGGYSVLGSEDFQICQCKTVLVLGGIVQPQTQEISNCKICALLANEACS